MNTQGKYPCIQKITNDINNKVQIGQTIEPHRRFIDHIQAAKNWETTRPYKSALYSAMNCYGIEHFHFEIIEKCEPSELSDREVYWIEKYNSLVPAGQNILKGGKSLYGENNPFYGKHHSCETKQKISEKNTGKKRTDEEKAMMSVRNQGENNPFYGKTHSDETKKRIKEKQIANGTYQRASERMKLNNPNDGTMFCKKTLMLDKDYNLLAIFDSAMDAGQYVKNLGLTKAKFPSNSISDVCRGIQKTAYGFYWTQVECLQQCSRGICSNQFIIKRKDD